MVHFEIENEDRMRCYGKRIGDIVRIKFMDYFDFTTEVIGLEALADNNRLYVVWNDGTIMDYIASMCDIVTKVEDRGDSDIIYLEETFNNAFEKLINTPKWYETYRFERLGYEWIYKFVLKPYEEGTCSIYTMVSYVEMSGRQVFVRK